MGKSNPLLHAPWVQRIGKFSGRLGRQISDFLLDRIFPIPSPVALPDPEIPRKVLLLRPNFRIGNALLATPLIDALKRRFPRAEVGVLTTDATQVIFERTAADRIHTTTRRSVGRPWLAVALWRELRREGYEVALEGGMGSFSGGLWAWLCGAPIRVGVDGRNRRFLNVPLGELHPKHAYDWSLEVARRIGSDCADHPVIELRTEDHAEARDVWREAGLLREDGQVRPHIAAFVGGHLDKRWGNANWVELIQALAARDLPVLVLVGPEEIGLARELARTAGTGAFVVAPGPLGRLGALLREAELVVSTDSGPMHLAVAAGATLLTLVTAETSRRYTPRGPNDATLVHPSAATALQEILTRLPPHLSR